MNIDDDRCVWVGNLSSEMTDEILYELLLQAGPIEEVYLQRENGRSNTFGYVTFKHPCSVLYSMKLFEETFLFGKKLKVRPKTRSAPEQHNLSAPNPLRRFGGDAQLRGRDDLLSPYSRGNSDMLPRKKFNSNNDNNTKPTSDVDFSILLQMTQQLQQLHNPYSSMEPLVSFSSPLMYPSQALDPIMNDRRDDSSRQNRRVSPNNRHRVRQEHDRYDSSHPYRGNRGDSRRHGHSSSRYDYSSSLNRRERR